MALDVSAIETELRSVTGELTLGWDDLAIYCKGKMMEAAMNGGVTSYTINGRSVTKDVRWWQDAYTFAKAQSSAEDDGGIVGVPVSFRAPTSRTV
jgi:hypothetical protein